jgi:hypothetical protein
MAGNGAMQQMAQANNGGMQHFNGGNTQIYGNSNNLR